MSYAPLPVRAQQDAAAPKSDGRAAVDENPVTSGDAVLSPAAPATPLSSATGAQTAGLTQTPPPPTTPTSTAPAAPAASQMSQAAMQTMTDLSLQVQHRAAAGQSQFRIQLTPDSVGKVDVALSIGRDGQTRAQLSFDNPQTAASFAGRLNELGDQLRQAGLNVAPDALSVKVMTEALNVKTNTVPFEVKAGDVAAGLAVADDATTRTDAQNASQASSQGASQASAQAAAQTSAGVAHPATAGSGQGGNANLSQNTSQNMAQNMAQNFQQPGGQSQSQPQPHPQQAARHLRNADQLGAIEAEGGLDNGLDAALSALRNRTSSSRLALNLIV